MSSKADRRESRSVHLQKEDEKLWENLTIDFSLEAQSFADNKINGIIKIKPKAARELIEHFFLVYNNDRTRFDPKFRHISAYGFDPTKRDFQIRIEAIPKNQGLPLKKSRPYTFSIVRQSFSLAPTLTFDYKDWNEKNKQSDLIIKWCHIGDQAAHLYVVSLDKKEIYFIREPSKKGTFEVHVRHLKPDKEEWTWHTIQIIAKLNNGKETCVSDLIRFTIPNNKNEQKTEVINVSNASKDPDKDEDDDDLQDNTMENDEKQKTKTSATEENRPPQTKKQEKHDEISAIRSCSCSRPHDSFPGIDHYFNIDNHQLSPTSVIKKTSTNDHSKPFTKSKRITHTDYDENEKEYDDDNDVVTNDTPDN